MVEEIGGAAATIARIYRYPVKGLSADPLQRISLAAGRCLPQDRRFAIALPTTDFDPDESRRSMSINAALAPCEWREKKINVLLLTAHPTLESAIDKPRIPSSPNGS